MKKVFVVFLILSLLAVALCSCSNKKIPIIEDESILETSVENTENVTEYSTEKGQEETTTESSKETEEPEDESKKTTDPYQKQPELW